MLKLAAKKNMFQSSLRSFDLKVNLCSVYFSTWNSKVKKFNIIIAFHAKFFYNFEGVIKAARSSQSQDSRRPEKSIQRCNSFSRFNLFPWFSYKTNHTCHDLKFRIF